MPNGLYSSPELAPYRELHQRRSRSPRIASLLTLKIGRHRLYAIILIAFLVFLGTARGVQNVDSNFETYYAASTLAAHGKAALAYNHQALTDVRTSLGALQSDRWSYPPQMLLLTTPFAHLPLHMAYGLWVVLGTLAYLLMLRSIAPVRYLVIMALSFPAYVTSLINGSNGTLSAAILGTGLVFMDSRPVLAGIILGTMTAKPQLAVLIPVFLITTKRWRPLCAFAGSTAVLALGSALLFGLNTWGAFIQHSGDSVETLKAAAARMPTVTAALLLLHAPFPLALVGQLLTAATATGVAIVIWRSDVSVRLKAATLPAATLLCTPYALYYDLTILAVSAAFLVSETRETGWLSGEKAAMVAIWASVPVYMGVGLVSQVQLGPLFVGLPLLLVVRRLVARRQVVAQASLLRYRRQPFAFHELGG